MGPPLFAVALPVSRFGVDLQGIWQEVQSLSLKPLDGESYLESRLGVGGVSHMCCPRVVAFLK